MSSAGHVQDMIQRQRANRAALKSKQAKFKQRKLRNIQYSGSGLVIENVDISKEELEQIKNEIRKEAAAYRRNRIIKVTVITIMVFGLILAIAGYYVFFY